MGFMLVQAIPELPDPQWGRPVGEHASGGVGSLRHPDVLVCGAGSLRCQDTNVASSVQWINSLQARPDPFALRSLGTQTT